jgi:hypothetical protein
MRMPPTRIAPAGVALFALTLPACLHTPAQPTAGATPAPLAGPVPPSEPVAVRREKSSETALRYIDLKSVSPPASPEPPLADAGPAGIPRPAEIIPIEGRTETQVGPVRVEPGNLELATLEDIPVLDVPPRPAAPSPAPDTPLVDALRQYEANAPDRAAEALRGLDPWKQDVLKALLPLAARLGTAGGGTTDPEELATALAGLEAVAAAARDRAALRIARLCFCRPVQAPARFGVYEPLDAHHPFRPGEVVAVYVELRNFACENRSGTCRTHVASAVELLDTGGHVAGRFDFDASDVSLSTRRDYCHVGRFPLPRLSAGAYTLRMTVTDVPTGRTESE